MKNKKQLTATQAQARIAALCKSLGIPYSQNQKSEGEASIHFLNKKDKHKIWKQYTQKKKVLLEKLESLGFDMWYKDDSNTSSKSTQSKYNYYVLLCIYYYNLLFIYYYNYYLLL